MGLLKKSKIKMVILTADSTGFFTSFRMTQVRAILSVVFYQAPD